MGKENYQLRLDATLQEIAASNRVPTLLLHACCAPCASYVLEYLSHYFAITLWYYNPNISPEEEYRFREAELARLVKEMPAKHPISLLEAPYDPERFAKAASGLESAPEGGERCRACFALRLSAAAACAAEHGFDYMCTTLSISPLKNATLLNEIGAAAAKQHGVSWLYADFKKREGYKRSCELSKQHGLYRQDYCGCVYSKKD